MGKRMLWATCISLVIIVQIGVLCTAAVDCSKYKNDKLVGKCKTNQEAETFVNGLVIDDKIHEYVVFNNKDSMNNAISYSSSSHERKDTCLIMKPVQTWRCTRIWRKPWTCKALGNCNAMIADENDKYLPATLDCPCPNSDFEAKRVFATRKDAETFIESINPPITGEYVVFNNKDFYGNAISYEKVNPITVEPSEPSCFIKEPVQTAKCNYINNKWECGQFGICKAESTYDDSVLIRAELKCTCDPKQPFADLVGVAKSKGEAAIHLNTKRLRGMKNTQVFNNKDFDGNPISYFNQNYNGKAACAIKTKVQTFECTRDNDRQQWSEHKCFSVGECLGTSLNADGLLIFDKNNFCPCPHSYFNDRHVCHDCKTEQEAAAYCKQHRAEDDTIYNTLFGHGITGYDKGNYYREPSCKTKNKIITWECSRLNKNLAADWTCKEQPKTCYGVAALNNGHYLGELAQDCS